MPLHQELISDVMEYCHRDLREREWYTGVFSFIGDRALQERLGLEYYSARYLYKLGEALYVDGERMHSHAKFQIMQYASIYEAVIVHLLWSIYPQHPAVAEIEWHNTYKMAAEWPKSISAMTSDGMQSIFLCVEKKERTPRMSIKFDDKVDALVKIGCIEKDIGDEIKEFYKLRNGMHLENAVKNSINYELDMAQLAFRRIWAFTRQVRGFLHDGKIPDDAKLRSPSQPVSGEMAEKLDEANG